MTILQTQFIAIFALAALFGFLLGRWSVQRSFVDVTESWEALKKAAEGDVPWDMLWARFDSVDVSVRRIVQEELDARRPHRPEHEARQ